MVKWSAVNSKSNKTWAIYLIISELKENSYTHAQTVDFKQGGVWNIKAGYKTLKCYKRSTLRSPEGKLELAFFSKV